MRLKFPMIDTVDAIMTLLSRYNPLISSFLIPIDPMSRQREDMTAMFCMLHRMVAMKRWCDCCQGRAQMSMHREESMGMLGKLHWMMGTNQQFDSCQRTIRTSMQREGSMAMLCKLHRIVAMKQQFNCCCRRMRMSMHRQVILSMLCTCHKVQEIECVQSWQSVGSQRELG